MQDLLLRLLESNTETEVLEFKEAKNQFDRDKLGKYFSALSNEANLKGKDSAWLIFGVSDNKLITGTNIEDARLNEYKAEVAKNTSPVLSFDHIHRVEIEDKCVLLLQIPAAPQGMPVAWKGLYYGRDGESLGGLNIHEIERIRNQNRASDWSAQIVSGATIDDLSEEAIEKAKIQYAEKNPRQADEMQHWDNITFLNKAKLTINGQITNAAILLLGQPEAEHFINPSTAKITWILKDRDGIEKDYEHFTCPLFLEVENVYAKIRNIKYRYMMAGTLFPEEVNQYDTYTIREALNNCIAHQDYTLAGKINLVENEDGFLVFSNSGDFIPQSIEKVIEADAPETQYRNPFLASAMVNLNMIDTIGSGIRKMFVIQKNKFFPLPEYNLSDRKVIVTIIGKVIDTNYAQKLAQLPELTLSEIMLLDKVAKKKALEKDEIKKLKAMKLIEGRNPNFHISASVAAVTGEESSYINNAGLDDEYYMDLILKLLKQFKVAGRKDIDKLLEDKLPNVLSSDQKMNKIKNLLQKLKALGKIKLGENKKWTLDELK